MALGSVAIGAPEIDEAVKKYYGGFPDEAISMIKPMALAGDVDAQYLLGNILYSLSKTEKYNDIDDPVKWYEMAAEQNSAVANYALGVIFHNKWIKSRDKKDAATAVIYYQRAADLGYKKAQAPLNKVKSRSGISHQEAVAVVKDQETKTVPETEPRVQTVSLAEFASQCQNYTQTGFDLYVETIKGALFSGTASMYGKIPEPSKSGTYLIKLTDYKYNIAILLNLHDVPEEISTRFGKRDKFGITGIVIDSKALGSGCVVNLIYQSSKS